MRRCFDVVEAVYSRASLDSRHRTRRKNLPHLKPITWTRFGLISLDCLGQSMLWSELNVRFLRFYMLLKRFPETKLSKSLLSVCQFNHVPVYIPNIMPNLFVLYFCTQWNIILKLLGFTMDSGSFYWSFALQLRNSSGFVFCNCEEKCPGLMEADIS